MCRQRMGMILYSARSSLATEREIDTALTCAKHLDFQPRDSRPITARSLAQLTEGCIFGQFIQPFSID